MAERAAPTWSRWLLVAILLPVGILHLAATRRFVPAMPPILPAPELLILASGLAELLIAALLLRRATLRLGGWLAIALLIAVFPANLHMALHPEAFPRIPAWLLWARLPVQGLFLWWAWRCARAPRQ